MEIGSGGGTSYPASLDTNATLESGTTKARADVPNDLAAGMVAVQATLGTSPQGTAASVGARIGAEHNADGTHPALVHILASYTQAALPAAGTPGRLARVTDNIRGIWKDTGTAWVSVTGYADVSDFATAGLGTGGSPWTGWEAGINALPASTRIYFRPGDYTIATSLAHKNGWHITGEGVASTITSLTTDLNLFRLSSVSGVTISRLRLIGAGASTGDLLGNCIYGSAVTNSLFESLYLSNARNGIVLDTNSGNCQINTIMASNMVAQYGVYLLGCYDVTVNGGVFTNSSQAIIAHRDVPDSNRRSRRIKVIGVSVDNSAYSATQGSGVSFYHTDQSGVFNSTVKMVSATAGSYQTGVAFAHCTFCTARGNIVTGGTNDDYAFYSADTSDDCTFDNNLADTVANGFRMVIATANRGGSISNNLLRTYSGVGILFDAGSLRAANARVVNNVVIGGSGNFRGIRMERVANGAVQGNTVQGSDSDGILVIDCSRVSVMGNTVTDADLNGIQINNSPHCIIQGNQCIDNNQDNAANTDGITVIGTGSTDLLLSGNLCKNIESTGHQKYGIAIRAAVTGVMAVGNQLAANETGALLDSGTATYIRGNSGVTDTLTQAHVIATGSLPAAGSTQDSRIVIEDNGTGDRNLIIYAGGQRFRIDGGAAF